MTRKEIRRLAWLRVTALVSLFFGMSWAFDRFVAKSNEELTPYFGALLLVILWELVQAVGYRRQGDTGWFGWNGIALLLRRDRLDVSHWLMTIVAAASLVLGLVFIVYLCWAAWSVANFFYAIPILLVLAIMAFVLSLWKKSSMSSRR